jgi:adenine phosphoribosyltransferase
VLVADLKRIIREIPDYPKPGVLFFDLTPVFRSAEALRSVVSRMGERFRGEGIDAVAGIEARGLVLAAPIALELGVGLALVRKSGKLPWETVSENYDLEYGQGVLEVHRDAVAPGQKILVVDDVLATGGTARATGRLVEGLGGRVQAYAFLVELGFLGGRQGFGAADVFSLVRYD